MHQSNVCSVIYEYIIHVHVLLISKSQIWYILENLSLIRRCIITNIGVFRSSQVQLKLHTNYQDWATWHPSVGTGSIRPKQDVLFSNPVLTDCGYIAQWNVIRTYTRLQLIVHMDGWTLSSAESRFVSSQCETALLCNDVSHWLGAGLESALHPMPWTTLVAHWLIIFLKT